MKITKILFVTLFMMFIFTQISALRTKISSLHRQQQQPVVQLQDNSCSKQACMTKYNLFQIFNPFESNCNDNAACWRQWYGLPDCQDKDLKCWRQAVGYPKNCSENDYDCWIKYYQLPQCNDVKCIKEFTNYTCSENDLDCWKNKVFFIKRCQWNDWDCWIQANYLEMFCHDKKGYECLSHFYGNQCEKTDQNCWREKLFLPSAECQKNVSCYKNFYFLPSCSDDDLDCWKKLIYAPNCQKGDMKCLKDFLWLPKCQESDDQVQCYKDWLRYPDCQKDDAECWKQTKREIPVIMYHHKSKNHKKQSQHRCSYGQYMQDQRMTLSNIHKNKRQKIYIKHMKKLKSLHKKNRK